MEEIVVLGSFMMDLVTNCERIPMDGETLIGQSFTRNAGGKGANQAATIARLGKKVAFIGMVGQDDFGIEAKKVLQQEQVNVEGLFSTSQTSTGVGCVWLDQQGNNRIIVIPGANHAFNGRHLAEIKPRLSQAKLLILQLEMALDLTVEAINYAKANGIKVLLNPAPASLLADDILQGIDYLTPNESELAALTGLPVRNTKEVIEAASVLIKKGVRNVIVTLGENGALWLDETLHSCQVAGNPVKVVDTVAAGDSFNGALAFGIVEEMGKEELLMLANKVGALTVTKAGAIKSLPMMEEVSAFT